MEPPFDLKIEEQIRPFFEDYYSIRFNNYRVGDEYLHAHQVVPLRAGPGADAGEAES